jgi:hypothetical protein
MLRTFSSGYYGTRRVSTGEDGWSSDAGLKRLRELQAEGIYVDQQPGWRCVIELKCSHCKERTIHAYIRDDEWKDLAEEKDRTKDRERREAHRKVQRRLRLLAADGVPVIYKSLAEMRVEGCPVEVVEFSDTGVEVRVCLDDTVLAKLPGCLLRAEDVLDDMERLGEWTEARAGRKWRGVALPAR